MREEERGPTSLVAKDPLANVRMDEHVSTGSKGYQSQYISTSSKYSAVRDLAVMKRKGDYDNLHIVKINLDVLPNSNRVTDVTEWSNLNSLTSPRAGYYAQSYAEVLIEGYIPAYAFEAIYSGSQSACLLQEP